MKVSQTIPFLLQAAGLTDAGCVRERNEDAFLVDIEMGLSIVADGMGGRRGGDIAARLAVESLQAAIRERWAKGSAPRPDDLVGMSGLLDASRAPRQHPNQSPPEVEAAVLRVRKAHPTWGSKKILATLDRERPDEHWPARSTIDAILKRGGVVAPRGRRRRRQPSAPPVVIPVRLIDDFSPATGTPKRSSRSWSISAFALCNRSFIHRLKTQSR